MLGDGPVAVALVVRWSACLARRGGLEGRRGWGGGEAMEAGTDSGPELGGQEEGGVGLAGILLSAL